MEEVALKPYDWNVPQLIELIQKFQDKDLEFGREKGISPTEEQIKFNYGIFSEPELLLGAYYDGELLAILGAAPTSAKFQGSTLQGAGVGRWGVNPEVLSKLTQGESEENLKNFTKYELQIFQKMIEVIVENALKAGLDFLYAIPALDEGEIIADFLEEEGGWHRLNKNVENITKLMGSEGVELIKEKRGLNLLEAQAAKLVAKMKKDRIQSGEIRAASPKDVPAILDLLNNYSEIHEMAKIWSLEELEGYLQLFDRLKPKTYQSKEEYAETPFGPGIHVWDDNGVIKAVIIIELNETYLKYGFSPIMFVHQLAFSNEILNKEAKAAKQEKKDFMGSFLAPYHKKVANCYAFLPYYDEKAFDGFLGERRTTRLLIKVLSEKAAALNEIKKLKKFYLNFVGFTVP